MHTLRRAPQWPPSTIYLCKQCRHATTKTTSKTSQTRLAIKATARDLAERSAILRQRVHAARVARREDWLLGPLAPNRAAADPEYGCVSPRELQGIKGLHRTRQGRSPYMAPEMKWEDSLVEVGDRVVVVARDGPASRERGKVGKVSEVRREQGVCVVDSMNTAYIKTPSYLQALEPKSDPIKDVTLPLPLSAVRVVQRLTNQHGVTSDIIIWKMVRLPHKHGRYIANSERATGKWLEVPIDSDSKKKKPEPKDQESDTLLIDVEENSWVPTLLRAPMPAGVIDELRNKYSKHRTRHDPGYQLALENRQRRTAEWKAWAKSGGAMLSSPAKEAAAKARDERAGRPQPTLRTEILEKIGEVMAGKGIELTEERRREMERNLSREGVVGGGEGDVVKGKAEVVHEDDVEGEVDAEGELQDAMERLGIDEVVIEEETNGRREGEARR